MAITDAKLFIRNAPNRISFPIMDANNEPVAAVTSPDSQRSLDGGDFAVCTAEITEIDTASGVYHLDLTVAECTGDQLVYKIGSSGTTRIIVPHVVPALDSGVAQLGGSATIKLRSGASGTVNYYNGAVIEIVRGTGAGQSRVIIGYNTTRIVTVDRVWSTAPDSSSVYVVHPMVAPSLDSAIFAEANIKAIDDSTAAAGLLKALYQGGLISATIDDTTPANDNWTGSSGLSATDDAYNGQLLVMVTGTFAGSAERISNYVGSSKLITLRAALPGVPADGDAFVILGRII